MENERPALYASDGRRDDARKLVSVVAGCYNEEENVRELYRRVRAVFDALGAYRWELIFADNASRDGTLAVLRQLAAEDRRVKVIVNWRNFGHIRSPYHALLQARGDVVISMASDLQDPPELITDFLSRWESGKPVVLGVKASTRETPFIRAVRRAYYGILHRLSDVEVIQHATGFGLYDKSIVDIFRELDDPYPYARGLISEFGLAYDTVSYDQPPRKAGTTKNDFYSLYDLAMVGITSHSKVPLRLATLAGFALSLLSLLTALAYLVAKLVFWYRYPAGVAPILIGMFVAFSVQLFFMGLIGEYIAVIHTRVMKRPLVVERERINFEETQGPARNGAAIIGSGGSQDR
ncbi:MAG TPA: glycosyltransferase family 2 protein [Thermoanaerobaculia bacterium]|nr:glycosyltransferase family 2 protein [Thermoanaerobaculia bacterium]